MGFIRHFYPRLCVLVMALQCLCCAAQETDRGPGKHPAKILPPASEVGAPFDLQAPASQRVNAIEFRSEAAMNAEDRQITRNAWPAIEKQAALTGFELGLSRWSFRQIVCPVLPQHLLLLFTRNNGANDRSEFSAALLRQGKGPVRILPILRRSYSTYSPASVNMVTIAAFNGIRAHDLAAEKTDWLTTGLCYAAMTGAHVTLAATAENRGRDANPLVMSPLIEIGDDGLTVIRFMDVDKPERPQQWEMTFNRQGKLLKVAVSTLPAPAVTLIP